MRTKLLAISVISLGMVGLTAIPAFATGSTNVSQVYTVTLQAPTLGLTLTAPTTTTASQVLPSGGTLTSVGNYIDTSAYDLTLSNSGNTSGTLSSSVTESGGSLTEVLTSVTPSANQFDCGLNGVTSSDYGGAYDTTGNLSLYVKNASLASGATTTVVPALGLGAGTGAGNYSFTFNFTIS